MERHMTVPSRALVIVSTIVVLALALLLVLANGASAGGEVETSDYRVRSGDTLWVIADRHAAADDDIRAVVEQIRRLNDLDSGIIQAGQVLAIPVRH